MIKRFKEWLIKKLGGYTKAELNIAEWKARSSNFMQHVNYRCSLHPLERTDNETGNETGD